MSKKAVEIQMLWIEDTREYGDYFAEIQSDGYITTDVFYSCPEENNLEYVKNPVWLPRQDQLQDMLDLKPYSFGKSYKMNIGRTTDKWTMYCEDGPVHCSFSKISESLEQLWLAFVMHEKYGKTWNGKEWIR